MASLLVEWYDAERAAGRGHASALRRLARRVGVDDRTIRRVLNRADRRRFPLHRGVRPEAREGRAALAREALEQALHARDNPEGDRVDGCNRG